MADSGALSLAEAGINTPSRAFSLLEVAWGANGVNAGDVGNGCETGAHQKQREATPKVAQSDVVGEGSACAL